ncbi:MAG: NAD(P)H-dependent oxidoreductase [Cardiobacteriaceae bacterium]|nr:NAD(P)H-dependent oxidoreductase [Cardiobacteriaceae bacterium]
MQKLIINAHPAPHLAAHCTNQIVTYLHDKLPDAEILNLYDADIPTIDSESLPLYSGEKTATSAHEQHIMARRMKQVTQFKTASRIFIAMPLHNLSIPSRLKDYIDNIVMPGQTFSFTSQGPQGLLSGHKALLLQASGSVYRGSAGMHGDHSYNLLNAVLTALGFPSLDIIRIEGTRQSNIGAEAALTKAKTEIDTLLPHFLK